MVPQVVPSYTGLAVPLGLPPRRSPLVDTRIIQYNPMTATGTRFIWVIHSCFTYVLDYAMSFGRRHIKCSLALCHYSRESAGTSSVPWHCAIIPGGRPFVLFRAVLPAHLVFPGTVPLFQGVGRHIKCPLALCHCSRGADTRREEIVSLCGMSLVWIALSGLERRGSLWVP